MDEDELLDVLGEYATMARNRWRKRGLRDDASMLTKDDVVSIGWLALSRLDPPFEFPEHTRTRAQRLRFLQWRTTDELRKLFRQRKLEVDSPDEDAAELAGMVVDESNSSTPFEASDLLVVMLRRLSRTDRIIGRLRLLQDMPATEVAKRLGICETTVNVALRRRVWPAIMKYVREHPELDERGTT